MNRAYKTCNNWKDFDKEIEHIKQILINNNYPNNIVDKHIKNFINKKLDEQSKETGKNNLNIYYKNQMHANYEIEERIIKEIVTKNTKCIAENEKLRVIFYYKNKKTAQSVIKNSPKFEENPLDVANVIYKFECNFVTCKSQYVGHTRTSLRKRINAHSYKGSIFNHYEEVHNEKPDKKTLYEQTSIIEKENDYQKLTVKEALIIHEKSPKINVQWDNFQATLRLYKNKNIKNFNQNNFSNNSNFAPSHTIQPANHNNATDLPR